MSLAPIFFISGTPGSGKTSLSKALLQRFAFGIHLSVDALREQVVSGMAPPVPGWTKESSRQFALARTSAVQTARLYATEGFAVAIEDVILAHEVRQLQAQLDGFVLHKVLLRPRLEIALKRNRERTNKGFDTTFLIPVIEKLYTVFLPEEFTNEGWLVLDTSGLSLEQTVDRILAHPP